jgi:Cu(I)/Ag(I) efflux system membrane protein CusA/SilA
MLARWIEACARRRGLTLAVVALLALWGAWSARTTPLDALPDLSDTQVIVFTEWMGRSPSLVEDQITYPIVTTFLAAPRVKVVRGFTMFGMSFVYVIFEDGTDIYWARSRVLENLVKLQGRLPPGVAPQLGPDATGVGWVFEYALVDETGRHDLQQLRSFQDWHLRYWLSSVPGVAEVASLGGYEKEYQVEIDPVRLQAFDLSIADIAAAIRMSNGDVGGRVLELAQHEYAVRGRGYLQDREAIAKIVVATDARGTPVQLGDVARIQVGGNIRRGFAELDGRGETVGGIVVMRFGENALDVIARVKAKLAEMEPSLPPGVRVVTTYDRSELIEASVRTLSTNLVQVMAIVCATIVVFLFHFRSALVPAITLPIAVLIAFIPMAALGVTTNIMSLDGIIIAIGDMVDAAVVLVEDAHRKLASAPPGADRVAVVIASAKELGPPIFGSLLVIAVAFLPVFTLEAQEGRLFKPLAYTKTFAMLAAALLSITLVPALIVWLVRGRVRAEEENPIARALRAAYRPVLRVCLVHRKLLVAGVLALIAATAFPLVRLGSEFMPPLYEGSVLFMPISVPGISIEEAKRLVQEQDRRLAQIPEVARVFGKAGRAETPTDPAPLSMIETVITLKPRDEWRPGMTADRLIEEMDAAAATPGLQAAWTMPIKARVDMLTTGIRTPVGVKVFGSDLEQIAALAESLERILRDVPGTRSVYAERELGGFYLDFVPDRDAIARYGLRTMDVLEVVETAIGGLDVDTTIEGRERYRINVRYPRELRDTPEALARVLVPIPRQRGGGLEAGTPDAGEMAATPVSTPGAMDGMSGRRAQVRLGQLGTISVSRGAADDQERGRDAHRLGLRRHQPQRHRRLRRRREGRRRGEARAAGRVLRTLDGAIRVSRAHAGAHAHRGPAHDCDHPRHLVRELRRAHARAAGVVLAAVRGDRVALVVVGAWLQHVGRGVGRADRAAGHRGRDGVDHGRLPRRGTSALARGGPPANTAGLDRDGARIGEPARAAAGDDGGDEHRRARAGDARQRHRRRRREAHRGSALGRARLAHAADARGDSRAVRDVAFARAARRSACELRRRGVLTRREALAHLHSGRGRPNARERPGARAVCGGSSAETRARRPQRARGATRADAARALRAPVPQPRRLAADQRRADFLRAGGMDRRRRDSGDRRAQRRARLLPGAARRARSDRAGAAHGAARARRARGALRDRARARGRARRRRAARGRRPRPRRCAPARGGAIARERGAAHRRVGPGGEGDRAAARAHAPVRP